MPRGKGRSRDLAAFGFNEPIFVDDTIDFEEMAHPSPKGPKGKKGKHRPSFDLDAHGRKGGHGPKGPKGGFKGRPHFGARGF